MEGNQNPGGAEPIVTHDEALALGSPEGMYKYVPKEEETPEQKAAKEAEAAEAARKATEQAALDKEKERLAGLSDEDRQKEEARIRSLASNEPIHQPFLLLQKAFPGINLPDLNTIKPENAAQALVKTIVDNYDFSEVIDPNLLALQERMVKENLSFEQVISSIRPPASENAKLSGDELLMEYYKDSFGLDDEEAKAAVAETSNKTIETKKAKKYFENKATQEQTEYNNRLLQQQEQEWKAHLQSVNNDADQLLAKAENFTDIWGVEISKADRDNFKPLFKKLVIPESPDQPALIHQILENDELLYQVAYSLVHGRDLIESLKAKPEEVREAIEKRLLESPKSSNKNFRKPENSNSNDMSRFAEPEVLLMGKIE